MLSELVILFMACTPRQTAFCTREFNPARANGTTYSNQCLAESAGFYGNCSQFVVRGECNSAPTQRITCTSDQFLSEQGMCVTKPWSDFTSCVIEKNQGACPDGNDPNPWVGEHCAVTCGVYVRTTREHDGR